VRNHRLLHGVAFTAAIAVLLTGTLGFAADDAAILRDIEARFENKNVARDADVQVTVQEGEVTLTGVATSLPASREAEKQARKEAKVVHNQIQVRLEEPVKEGDIIDGVRKAVLRYPYYEVFDYVEFTVNDGAIRLMGSVDQPYKRSALEGLVARVPGVRAIQNDIVVQSFSPFDSELRYSLARRIYGDPRFVRYSNRAHPPIRILVDRGNVTLAGWVNSPVEKAILGNIALSTLSFTVTNNLRIDGEVPAEDRKGNESTES
jgi:osmotically-inducible protein OsmY